MRVVGIAGSLRRNSWNRKLLRIALDILRSKGVEVEEVSLKDIPPYNADVEDAQGYPPAVAAFRNAIHAADAVVIASPEYNNSVPGVLKNAIDWASRPPDVFYGKPVFVMGASPGRSGAARMHMHLSYILESMGAWVLPQPRVLLSEVARVISEDGQVTDPLVGELLEMAMVRLLDFIRRLTGKSVGPQPQDGHRAGVATTESRTA